MLDNSAASAALWMATSGDEFTTVDHNVFSEPERFVNTYSSDSIKKLDGAVVRQANVAVQQRLQRAADRQSVRAKADSSLEAVGLEADEQRTTVSSGYESRRPQWVERERTRRRDQRAIRCAAWLPSEPRCSPQRNLRVHNRCAAMLGGPLGVSRVGASQSPSRECGAHMYAEKLRVSPVGRHCDC